MSYHWHVEYEIIRILEGSLTVTLDEKSFIATAGDIEAMAGAFRKAIEAGRSAYLAGTGRVLEKGSSASSPLTGFLQD